MRDPAHIRLLRLLLLLYPPSLRRRSGREILASARRAAAAGHGRPAAVLADGVLTLGRAWARAVIEAFTEVSPRRTASALHRDAVLTLRGLARRPLQGAVIVLTLAVALGANAAIYTVTHGVLLETLPYEDIDHVMRVEAPPLRMVGGADGPYWLVGQALAEHPGVASAATFYRDAAANLVEGADASRVRITQVSDAFFQVLGAPMLLGPGIRPGDDAADQAVLSYPLWQRAFGGERDVIGRTLRLNGRSFRVAGVAVQGVDFPAGTELWLSDPPIGEFFGGALGPDVVARLRPGYGSSVTDAMRSYAASTREEAGPEYADRIRDPVLIPVRSELMQDVRLPLLVLSAAAAALLLLGCVNVAGVSLARLSVRRGELAMRRALGASGGRIFGQLMAELGVLALVAGTLSVLLAAAMVPLLVALLPAATPRLDQIRPGLWTLAFTAAATCAAALLAGLPAAIAAARGARSAPHPDRVRPDDVGGLRFQGVLTGAQVALAVALVVVASLLGRSLAELRAVPLGYDTRGVLTFQVRLPDTAYPDGASRQTYVETVRARLAALPGVAAVGVTDRLPLADGMGIGGRVWRAEAAADTETGMTQLAVNAGFFDAMGIDLVEGRAFQPGDEESGAVIVARELARTLFGETSAVGQRLAVRSFRTPESVHVVGVAGDVRLSGMDTEGHAPVMYEPLAAARISWPAFAVRTAGPPTRLAPEVRAILAQIDPAVPPFDIRTTGDAVAELLAARRAVALLAALFGAAALLLAALAVYGLQAQGVARRQRELGIRLALGATAGQIQRFVVARGLAWTALGTVAGLLLGLGAARLLEGLLFGVAPRDPRHFAAAALAVFLAAAFASWLPARRAGRTDPLGTLRGE
ncbi:MAG: ABC transporter permease [Gemmatimonadota bacterium]